MQKEMVFRGNQLDTRAVRAQYILPRLEYHPLDFESIRLRHLSTCLSTVYAHNLLDYGVLRR